MKYCYLIIVVLLIALAWLLNDKFSSPDTTKQIDSLISANSKLTDSIKIKNSIIISLEKESSKIKLKSDSINKLNTDQQKELFEANTKIKIVVRDSFIIAPIEVIKISNLYVDSFHYYRDKYFISDSIIVNLKDINQKNIQINENNQTIIEKYKAILKKRNGIDIMLLVVIGVLVIV